MRIGVLADIHGNLPALDAVLIDIADQNCDQIVCLGDVSATGPQPRETIARLRDLDIPCIMGNTDAWLLDPRPPASRDEDSVRFYDVELWAAQQLSPVDRDFLGSFKPRIELQLGETTSILCFHGSPGSNTDLILPITPDEEIEPMIAGYRASVMAGGHTHVPMFRRYCDVTLLNPGSVGLPFERLASSGRVRNPPWAEYATVSFDRGALGFSLKRVPYDVRQVTEAAHNSGMPHAGWWSRDWDLA